MFYRSVFYIDDQILPLHIRGCLIPELVLICKSFHQLKPQSYPTASLVSICPQTNQQTPDKPSQPVTHFVFQFALSISTCQLYHNTLSKMLSKAALRSLWATNRQVSHHQMKVVSPRRQIWLFQIYVYFYRQTNAFLKGYVQNIKQTLFYNDPF